MELVATFAASFLVSALTLGISARVVDGMKIRGALGYLTVPLLFALLETLLGGLLTFALTLVLGVLIPVLGLLLGFVARIFVRAYLIRLTGRLTKRLEVDGWGIALKVSVLVGLLAFGAELLARAVF
ncbi:MAG TPA: phage holin family protein [Polyangiaceae bacterium LLY-WYZ-15_(1-7)]|nr:hypothetical protein [Myxococcales bacterium]MAT27345.1 hypothetical protein [Sandaracinus sp.]HJK89972.1 phage holin family protein [Polyangiaceae bacterium LLY-WYZ-15_(1-7)]MBJ74080.1 hypothetical protein [Sandaracinus sp.]HJL06576.1 phage holin family protein [Polyangiaceae bacterium LLY-WYZ-15_(1-7)]